MLTAVEGQGTTARNSWYDPGAITAGANDYSAKYIRDTSGTAIRINGDSLLNNTIKCDYYGQEPYCLDAGSWQPATIKLEEDFANQIAAEVAKKLNKQIDPLEKNAEVDEVEIPPMSGFIAI